eukprot:m.44324 g.44324  ORF g.44324 m.44324 type:complete len:56 (-) comp12105_c0_seq2:80-247(-)
MTRSILTMSNMITLVITQNIYNDHKTCIYDAQHPRIAVVLPFACPIRLAATELCT